MFKNTSLQKIQLFAFIPSTGLPKTGDAANLTAYVRKDFGTLTVLGNTSATEVDATNGKGFYEFNLTQAETNADTIAFTGKSSTADVAIVPVLNLATRPPNFGAFAINSAGFVTLADGSFSAAKIFGGAFSSAMFAADFLTAAKVAPDVAAEIVAAIFAKAFNAACAGYTFEQIIGILLCAEGGRISGADPDGPGPMLIRNLINTLTVISSDGDGVGNRTSVTITPP